VAKLPLDVLLHSLRALSAEHNAEPVHVVAGGKDKTVAVAE
jgi:hypothetical protein